ncbi:PREDICTED: LON peptidase N-terminal domain and RING finger protein 3 isoform X2 [Nanorana parkeri]|uniref:LON peptidase N-terminal domain and RING finger protein 3 isoform X2 n=1 Tax=Nanorana parkeri TaxID=125878 RepID=UPI0008548128|nr:PREDICTED: LON peptidase N-terminal domain and RING finger protein 3 isoform X2 [Nanorana parkeri]
MGTQEADGSLMLEFAAQAFQAKNFQLACEIYERQLRDQQAGVVDWGLLLKRAECLACCGQLQDAFDLYHRAAAQKKLCADQLGTLVTCLAEQIRSREPPPQSDAKGGIVTCQECQGVLCEPVTLPCGHTFCRKCLETSQCKVCRATVRESTDHHYRVNVVLSNVISKWFPSEIRAVRLAKDGSALLKDNRLEEALDKYKEAIRLVPLDHLLYSNRAMVYLSLKSYKLALDDAETACKLQPYWLKGHLRKAQALTQLGKIEDALKEFLFCLVLDSGNETAKSEAQKLLLNILSPGQSQGDFSDVLQMMSHPSRLKGSLMSSDNNINSHRIYRTNLEYKKNVILPEQTSPTGCNTVWKSLQPLENIKDGHSKDTLSSEECLKTSLTCNTLKRKLGKNDTSEVTNPEIASKLPKTDVSTDNSADMDLPVSSPVDSSDLECSLCMRLLYEPVTTPCGHTYCLKCLERCLDHNSKCPLCKEDLCEYLAMRKFCKTELMEDLITKYFPEELKERKVLYEEEIAELSNMNKNVPIFVCTMAYPTVPCPLHIFEPCYRLMIRRCMETGTKQFGMCIGDSVKGFADYGCLLEIRNVEFFADGRSVVDSIGKRRFKVIQHSQRDGYNTADIEYIEDGKVKENENTEKKLETTCGS